MPVHRFWSQESLVISKIDSPGRCQRLDLFIKVISVLCSYLTDASTDNFYSIFVSLGLTRPDDVVRKMFLVRLWTELTSRHYINISNS